MSISYRARLSLAMILAVLALWCPPSTCWAQGPAPSHDLPPTAAKQFAKAEVAISVLLIEAMPSETAEPGGTSIVEVAEIFRDRSKRMKKGNKLKLDLYWLGNRGDRMLLLGSSDASNPDGVTWFDQYHVDAARLSYILQAPPPGIAGSKRLEYFAKFLESPDAIVLEDAFVEFANASRGDLVLFARTMPRERLRKWILDPGDEPERRSLCGLLLGLCGDAQDAAFMEQEILAPTEERRFGMEGVMAGYVLLTGESGLKLIEEKKLKAEAIAFVERIAAMNSLMIISSYTDGTIVIDRLHAAMRILLNRPEFLDMAIIRLARMKDWTVQKRLMEGYGQGDYDSPNVKRAIIGYLLLASKDVPQGDSVKPPQHAVDAARYLEQLRKQDPKLVLEVERVYRRR